MRPIILLPLLAMLAGLPACATRTATEPAEPVVRTKAELTLDEIEPRPQLPEAAAAPADHRAPIEALELYARARGALLRGERSTAVRYLEQALQLDSYSFELNYMMGQALLDASGGYSARAAEAFERAARLRPDHIDVQAHLGRQYLASEDREGALHHLRLARLTEGYARQDGSAVLVDFLLARVLQDLGYERAALGQYRRILERMEYGTLSLRGSADIMPLLAQPEMLLLQIGRLHQRLGEAALARAAFEQAAERQPGNLEVQSQVIDLLLEQGEAEAARRRAADMVIRYRAHPDALGLLRGVYQRLGREAAMADELLRLHQAGDADPAILFAAVDALRADGRDGQATRLLQREAQRSGYEIEVVRRLVALQESRGEIEAAGRVLVLALAARPEALRELEPMWTSLMRPSRRGRLRLPALQRMAVHEAAEPARLYWVSRMADQWHRDALARAALEQAVLHQPPFAPAYRMLLSQIWARPDWDEPQKRQATAELVEQAEQAGQQPLAAELRGLSLLAQDQHAEAVNIFAQAVRGGGESPELLFIYALALRGAGEDARAEQMLWKILSDWTSFEDAYPVLFSHYAERGRFDQALRVLTTWLDADPNSINARLLQAAVYMQTGRQRFGEQIVEALFREHPDRPEVLAALQNMYMRRGQLPQLVERLERVRQENPDNRAVFEQLVAIHIGTNQPDEAARVLDEARQALAGDADMLYYVAHLYGRIDRRELTEELLKQVVELDPTHAPAANDLGYTWADEGRNLERAEELIRIAVEAEPDNQAFLDSLGWVLYKRGEFEKALVYLERAVGPAMRPDPVVLDHYGDVLYRLGETERAVQQWRRAQQRLGEVGTDREDLRELGPKLRRKLEQAERGQPVDVAATVE